MPVTYDTIEVIDPADDLPVWSTVWPGTDGCTSRSVYYGSPVTFTNTPASTKAWYEPETQQVFRDSRREKGKRSGYPPLRYTNYSISRKTTKRYLVKRYGASGGLDVYYQYGKVPKIGSTCTPTITHVEYIRRYPSYYVVTHDFGAYTSYTINGFVSTDITSALSAVEDEVVNDAMTTYDVLTDIAEIKDIPHMITSISSDLRTILSLMHGRFGKDAMRKAASISPLDLLKHPDKILRKLGDYWMSYRYGIMPLVYSYRDLIKLSNRHVNVKTRKTRHISPVGINVSLPGPTSTYNIVSYVGDIVVSGNVFQSFSSDEVARMSGLGVNPLVTAWELIPYSFVVDWFVNVGDYLARKTNSTMAGQKWACLSRHDSYAKTTRVHLPMQNVTVPINIFTPTNWWGTRPSTPSPVILPNPEGLYLHYEEIVDSYSRWIFDVNDARLRLSPSLNWRRLIDSAVMALNQLRGFNSRFRI